MLNAAQGCAENAHLWLSELLQICDGRAETRNHYMTQLVADHRFTTNAERARRVDALRAAMTLHGLDALVIAGRDDIRFRGRVFYATDYWQLFADSHVVLTHSSGPVLIGGTVWGISQARQSDWISECRLSGTPGTEIGNVLAEQRVSAGKIGVVGLDDGGFAYSHYMQLSDALPNAQISDATDLFEKCRQVNSAESLAALTGTSACWNSIYAELEAFVRPGVTEIRLAAQAHRICREHGVRDPMVVLDSTPFKGATTFGTQKVIESGDVVTVWIESAGPNGTWLEYRRMYSVGPVSPEYRDMWQICIEAHQAGVAAMRPGAMASEFVEGVATSFRSHGIELDYTTPADQHRSFHLHGIGTDAIQGVWVSGNDRLLIENEVVNIHPHRLFGTPEETAKFGLFGLTDNILVTPGGGRWMTNDQQLTSAFVEL
ncbi:M24 family metallopeptidase [Mycolicibacterium mengxianglii]|uniref:M24 family metallopeptidase n=1 Tax=Mycolicibacterium mengxianglii TaxID=2736649 RepID=UPI0018EF042C|nr:M24 family metallopeptidase [Mycolicibacterium mengxianglii]